MISSSTKRMGATSLLGSIFFVSGVASLFYQVAWQRVLTVHYGVGTVSITLIVSVYMAGLGLGALLGGHVVELVRKNTIMLYVCVEVLLGAFGLISLPFLDFLGNRTAASPYYLSFCCILAFLIIPTVLMGFTLPLLTKIFNRLINDFLRTVSYLYYVNTLGAALGAILAGYIIISFFGLDSAVYFAVAINFSLALIVLLVQKVVVRDQAGEGLLKFEDCRNDGFGKLAYALVFITGFVAIGYEIIWFRVVGILVKSTPYAFCSVLSVYLLGIAFGSFGMNLYIDRYGIGRRKDAFFLIQFAIAVYVAGIFIGYYYLTKYTAIGLLTKASFGFPLHPWIVVPKELSLVEMAKTLYRFGDVLFWSTLFCLVPTILMGASFPLISSLAFSNKEEGKLIGTVYFFNVLGNVIGGLVTGLILLPAVGTEISLIAFCVVGFCFLLCVKDHSKKQFAVSHTVVCVLLSVLVIAVFPKSGALYINMHSKTYENVRTIFEEGIDGVFAAFESGQSVRNYINGLDHGGLPGDYFNAEALEAFRFVPTMERVLVIGFGTGSFVEAALRNEDVKQIVLVELNQSLIKNLMKIRSIERILSDSKLKIVFDDARRYLLRTDEKFDLIMMDPLRTTESYSNNLYSLQCCDLLNKHLDAGGIALLWQDEQMVVSRTRARAFPHLRKYGTFCLASNAPFKRNQQRFDRVLQSFTQDSQERIQEIFCSQGLVYEGNEEHVNKMTVGYPINEDLKPHTEYYLGLRIRQMLFAQ